MAKNKIAMGINLRKNKNQQNAGFGKYYPEVDVKSTLSLKGFAQHLVDHGSTYGLETVEGVLKKITQGNAPGLLLLPLRSVRVQIK